MAGRHGQYPPELRERAVRLVAECRAGHDSEWDAMRSVAQKLGIGTTETVRKWVRRANEILRAAAGFFAAELDRPHRTS
jgi:transposase